MNICIRQWQGHPFWLPNPPFRPPLHLPLSVQDSPDFSLARTVDMEWNPSSNYFIPASVSALTICTIVAQFICTRGRGREWEGVWANEQLPITTSFVNVSFEPFLSWRTHTHTQCLLAHVARSQKWVSVCEGAISLVGIWESGTQSTAECCAPRTNPHLSTSMKCRNGKFIITSNRNSCRW